MENEYIQYGYSWEGTTYLEQPLRPPVLRTQLMMGKLISYVGDRTIISSSASSSKHNVAAQHEQALKILQEEKHTMSLQKT